LDTALSTAAVGNFVYVSAGFLGSGAQDITSIDIQKMLALGTPDSCVAPSSSPQPTPVVVDVPAGYIVRPILPPTPTSTSVSTVTSTTSNTTSSGTNVLTSSSQATIDSLTAELQALEAQIKNSTFTRNLELYDVGTDVTELQAFLISQDAGPAAKKLNAHGTTSFFGMLTFNALVEFQRSVDIPATGYFGPITRAWVNAHGK
jgi:hypothetical protein